MKLHLSMPHDNQTNVYLSNGIRQFSEETGMPIDLTFTDHRHGSIQRVVEYINEIRPDVCLFLYLNDLNEFISYVECPIKCGWTFDITFGGKPIPESSLVEGISHLDYFFTVAPDHAKVFSNGYWVPEGCDPFSHFPVISNNKYDITFVGQVTENSDIYINMGYFHLDRQEWLTKINKRFPNQLTIFGPLVGQTGLDLCHTKRILKDSWDNNVISSNSLINLGHSGSPKVKYAWSARDLRIMAAGGFLLTNKVKGHNDFFKDGKNIALYDSTEECLDKIQYYLNNPEERQRIAQKSRERVLTQFTFKHSIETIFTHLEII